MKSPTRYTILIERRMPVRWIGSFLSILCLAALLWLQPARADTSAPLKIAADLQAVIAAPKTPTLSWVRDLYGLRFVKVLVISNSSDPNLTDLRAQIVAGGGAIYLRCVSVRALSVMMPAYRVAEIAQRSDVQGISPNRLTARTLSHVELTTGISNVRSTIGGSKNYSGFDGTGVGIAVLDSGVAWNHLGATSASSPPTCSACSAGSASPTRAVPPWPRCLTSRSGNWASAC